MTDQQRLAELNSPPKITIFPWLIYIRLRVWTTEKDE